MDRLVEAPATLKLTGEEIERYSRQILLREVGGGGQKQLAAAAIEIRHRPEDAEAAFWCGLYCGLAGVGRIAVREHAGTSEPSRSPVTDRLARALAARDPLPRIVDDAPVGSSVIAIGPDASLAEAGTPILLGAIAATRALVLLLEIRPPD